MMHTPTLHDVSHRTTLTLDDDVAAKLDREARRTGRPYRAVVNDALRRGLEAAASPVAPYVVEAQPLGLRPGMSIDCIAGLLDALDGPGAR
jgi:Ribbon-helix-helix protein, copG family